MLLNEVSGHFAGFSAGFQAPAVQSSRPAKFVLIAYDMTFQFRTFKLQLLDFYVQLDKSFLRICFSSLGEALLSLRCSFAPTEHPLDNTCTLQGDSSHHRSRGSASQSGCARHQQTQARGE